MGASSSSVDSSSVTINKEVYERYVRNHNSTEEELRSAKKRIASLQTDLFRTQRKLITEFNQNANSVTIDKEEYENYMRKHNSTEEELRSVKNQIGSLQTELHYKQVKSNKDMDCINTLKRDVAMVRTNLLKIQGEKAELSANLETIKWDLNQLEIKNNLLRETNDKISNQCNTYKHTSEDKDKQLEKTMVKLIQTKSDLEKVSQQLSEEIENKKEKLELENKYCSLQESYSKLEKEFRENRDEFDKMKTAFIECIDENRVLEEKFEIYEEDVKKLNGNLNETKLELDNVKLENKKLQTFNTNLSNELKRVKRDRSALKEEISKREQAITRHKNTITKLEDELHQCKNKFLELKEKSTKEDVTDETLRKIIQIYHQIQDLQQRITEKTNILVKEIKENDRNEKEKLIEGLKSDYDNCVEKLESKGININRTQFIDIYAKYKHLCQRNDDNSKNLFKLVYEIEKFVKDLRKRFDIFSENLNKDVEIGGNSEKDLNTKLLTQGFIAEEELYRDVVRIVKEEIAYREKLLNVNANDTQIKVKDCNILNNGKPDNVLPKTTQTQQKDNNTEDSCEPSDGNLAKNEHNPMVSSSSRGRNGYYKQYRNRGWGYRGGRGMPHKNQRINKN